MIPSLSLAQSATSGAGSGDISAGFINNASLIVGGSGKVAADTGSSGNPATGPTSQLPLIIIGGLAILGIVTLLILKK